MGKKEKTAAKKEGTTRREDTRNLRREHPFETDSQVQNRYGGGRQKSGSDGSYGDSSGNNH